MKRKAKHRPKVSRGSHDIVLHSTRKINKLALFFGKSYNTVFQQLH